MKKMGRPVNDLTGNRYGSLTVIKREKDNVSRNGRNHPMWLCECDCGVRKIVKGDKLKNGSIKSCGCKQRVHEFNDFREEDNTLYIKVGDNEVIIDKEDFPKIYPARVYIDNHGYAKCRRKDKLHKLICDCPKGYTVDHINQNKLDNRKLNLRVVTYSENNMNKKPWSNTGILGISQYKNGKYYVKINRINYGCTNSLDEAIEIRNKALKGTKQAEVNYFLGEGGSHD